MTKLHDANGKLLTAHGCGRCSACNTIQPASNFYADKTRHSGLSSHCKTCDKARMKTIPERSIVRDLKALMERHPRYRTLVVEAAAALAA